MRWLKTPFEDPFQQILKRKWKDKVGGCKKLSTYQPTPEGREVNGAVSDALDERVSGGCFVKRSVFLHPCRYHSQIHFLITTATTLLLLLIHSSSSLLCNINQYQCLCSWADFGWMEGQSVGFAVANMKGVDLPPGDGIIIKSRIYSYQFGLILS